MKALYVLFDESCELCRRIRQFLERQPAWVELWFIPQGSEDARSLFPALTQTSNELVVVSDEGEVYSGNESWIMCLWALKEYRDLAYRLSSPLLLPLAKGAFAALSSHRRVVSEWLRPGITEEEIRSDLGMTALIGCTTGKGGETGDETGRQG